MNSNITILVADDHPVLLKGLRDELLNLGFNVLVGATNGVQALDLIISQKPTIAILDINMPFLTGFDNEISPQIEKIKYLSPSERTIVRLIANGNSTKKIAEILSISSRTVDKHRSNIISKLDLPSDSDSLTLWVKENKDLLDNV